MSARNLADASFEPSDEDFRELCAHAAEDARAGHRAAEEGLRERIAAERPEAAELMVVGHEPEFSATIAELIGGGFVDMKKGGLARVDVGGPGLEDGVLAWLLTPSQLAGE